MSGGSGTAGRDMLLATARALEVDRITAEVTTSLAGHGVQAILLKGATVATWLYDDGTPRSYVDSDVLVPPDRFADAVAVLRQRGFTADRPSGPLPDHGVPHAEPFSRSTDAAQVDLHRTVSGASAPPEAIWALLADACVPGQVGGAEVQVPNIAARAMLCAFHAAQHGPEVAQPLEDLRRAVDREPLETWREAARLAASVGGVPSLASGLRLTPAGSVVADRLGLPSERLVQLASTPRAPARIAYGFERLSREKGAIAKGTLLAREAFPSPDFMRWWSPLARRGTAGLVAAYGRRLLWLAAQAGPSYHAWRRDQPDRRA